MRTADDFAPAWPTFDESYTIVNMFRTSPTTRSLP